MTKLRFARHLKIYARSSPNVRKVKQIINKSLYSSGNVFSKSNWNLEMLVFEERGKPEYPEKKLSEQGREPTTNSAHLWRRVRESTWAHWWEVSALTAAPSLLPHKQHKKLLTRYGAKKLILPDQSVVILQQNIILRTYTSPLWCLLFVPGHPWFAAVPILESLQPDPQQACGAQKMP